MSRQAYHSWLVLAPPFPPRSAAKRVFREHAKRLSTLVSEGAEEDAVDGALDDALAAGDRITPANTLRAALHVLTDLARQRWSVRVTRAGEVQVKRPAEDQLDPRREKARIRAQELVKSDEQLREPATRRFIQGMERRSVHGERYGAIYDLMRDGRDLAAQLREARTLSGGDRVRALREVVDPYLEFVDGTTRCIHTGLRLQDIWRYFRHTWTNQYVSTPGRSMAFLVRDRAVPGHPVMGIGALGSPIVQIRERDAWIGWHPDAFMEVVSESPSPDLGTWLRKTIAATINDIYTDDFVEDQLIAPRDIRSPAEPVIARLIEYGETQRELHHRLADHRELKRSAKPDESGSTEHHWRRRALTHLYKSKRALTLADMLRSRMVLERHLSTPPTVEEVRDLLSGSEGRRIVKKVLRKARADRVGIAMADITVCGAVAPYGPILGGKLVSMLAASPEVVDAYRSRYAEQESEIASSMAGRPIVRSSELVFLGTTSLYGVGSSQYNRVRVPAERVGGRPTERIEFLELGRSEAYGTSHFSSGTEEALKTLVQQSSNGIRVNSIFGEGVSPKLRKLRDGLDHLNLPAGALLQHGRQRIVYGVPLIRNLREFLLGMDDEPDYVFEVTHRAEDGTVAVACWWAERWLSKRIESDDVLERVEQHTLVRPVRHGARVILPRAQELRR